MNYVDKIKNMIQTSLKSLCRYQEIRVALKYSQYNYFSRYTHKYYVSQKMSTKQNVANI